MTPEGAIPKVTIRRDPRTGVVSATPVRPVAVEVEVDVLAVMFAATGPIRLAELVRAGRGDVVEHVRRAVACWRAGVAVPADVAPSWWTVEQAAAALGVSALTVRRWCASGRLVGRQHTARGRWSVDPSSVRRLVAAGANS